MSITTPAGHVASARMRYRAAEIRGHSKGCAVAWDGRQCSCPGRAAIHGRAAAESMERAQDAARSVLFDTDPNAGAWLSSRKD